jgi:arginase family enzyme
VIRIRIIITDLNDTYPENMPENLGPIGSDTVERISLKDIPGRNMYCTDECFEEIAERLSVYQDPEKGIHFIDTGNYHYMSRIFTSFIREKYDLILFDNHNDMQKAGFGDMLSCGSWALEVLEKDERLCSLYVYGPSSFEAEGEECDIRYVGKQVPGRLYRGRGYEEGIHPVYLSVDKDILDVTECVTNWDQGNLSLFELEELIKTKLSGKRLIGADICGGISETDPGCGGDTAEKNTVSDRALYQVIRNLFEEE